MSTLSTQANRLYPSLPNIDASLESHTAALQAIKDAVQTHERQDGNYLKSFVRFEELIDLGIINSDGVFILNTNVETGASSINLGDLNDVVLTSPSDDSMLGYDTATAKWIDQTAAQLGLATDDHTHPPASVTIAFDDLTDVELTGTHNYDLLFRDDDGDWKPTEQLLQWDGSDLHLPLGDLHFYAVGDSASSAIRQNFPTVGDLTLQVPGGDLFLQPTLNVVLDGATDLIIEVEQAIRWFNESGLAVELAILGAGVTGDDDAASVVLLATAETSSGDGDMEFISDIGNHTLTATIASGGVAEVSSTQAKFGTVSMFCDDEAGAMSARWGTTVNSTDFDFGSGDWTMECHLLFERKSATDIDIFAKWIWLDRTFHWTFDSTAETFVFAWSTNGTSVGGGATIAWPVDTYITGQWYHMAAVRDGNAIKFFVDGVLCGTTEDVTGVTFFTADQEFEIFSKESNGSADHATYMDNARITKGVARYTANFTPPTVAFPTTASETPGFTLGDPLVDMYLDANEIRIRGVTTDNYLAVDHDNIDINIVGVNTDEINITDIDTIRFHGTGGITYDPGSDIDTTVITVDTSTPAIIYYNPTNNFWLTNAAWNLSSAAMGAAYRWFNLNDGLNSIDIYGKAGTPESDIAANIGALSIDADAGELYIKETDTANTGWQKILRLGVDQTIPDTWTYEGRLVTDDSTTARAGFNIPIGVAPTTPVQGDIWSTATDLLMELSGGTETNAWISDLDAAVLDDLFDVDLTGAANNDLLHRSGGDWIDTAGALTWDGSTLATTGIISLPGGAVGAPSLAFTGDLDTGIFSPGANIFAITAGAIEAIRYTEASSQILADHSMETGITASTTQTQGERPLLSSYNEISVVANNDDVVTMPAAAAGRRCLVINKGAKRLQLFPASGDDIGAGIDTSVTIKANTSLLFVGIDGTTFHDVATRLESLQGVDLTGAADNDLLHRSGGDWIDTAGALTWDGSALATTGIVSLPAGTEGAPSLAFTGDLDTGIWSPGANILAISVGGTEAIRWTGASPPVVDFAMDPNITASTTQTQGQQPLTCSFNTVTVVANADDVVTMPSAAAGRHCHVINRGANQLQLFPASGQDIGAGIDTSITVEVGSAVFFIAFDSTTWHDNTAGLAKTSEILKSDVKETITKLWKFNGGIEATGVLALQPLANADVSLFASADVGDADNGKRFIVWRNAPEGNDWIRLYVTAGQVAMFQPSNDFYLKGPGYVKIESASHTYLDLGDNAGVQKVRIRDSDKNDVATIDSDGNAQFDGVIQVDTIDEFATAAGVTIEGVLLKDGFIGIGTAAPGLPLEVRSADDNQTMAFDSRAQAQGVGGGIAFGGKYTDAGAEAMSGRIGTQKTNSTSGHVGFDLVIQTQNSVGTMTERAIFTSNGKCGIGDVAPTKTLDVNGDTRIRGDLTVDGSIIGFTTATQEFFIPAGAGILDNQATFQDAQIELADAGSFARCIFTVRLPSDFSSMAAGYPKVIFAQGTGGTGNYRIAFNTYAGGPGEQLGARLDNIAEYTMAAPGVSSEIWEEDISGAFDGLSLAAGHYIELRIQRDSDDVLDTYAGDLNVLGVVVKYS